MGTEKQIYGVVDLGTLITSLAPYAIDASKGNYFVLTLAADVTFAVKNVKPGHPIFVEASQDNVGGHAVAWNGAGGQTVSGPTGDLAANASTTTVFELSGSRADMTRVFVSPRNPAPTSPHFSSAASPNLTASPQNEIWLLSGAAATPKLPDAASNLGNFCTVGLLNIAAGVVVGVTTGGDLIDGAATYSIAGNWHTATFFAYTTGGTPAWKAFPGGS